MSSNRSEIVARIQKLMAVTRERGATEAEALTAAAKAAELLATHNLSMSELEVRESEHETVTQRYSRIREHKVTRVCFAVSQLTDTIAWVAGGTIAYFGTKLDCEIAHYLTLLCRNAMDAEWAVYRKTEAYQEQRLRWLESPTALRSSFQHGMATRLNERIWELYHARISAERASSTTGTDLVVVKEQVVREAFEKLDLKLRRSRSRTRRVSPGAYDAGMSAAERVNLTEGIGQQATAYISR